MSRRSLVVAGLVATCVGAACAPPAPPAPPPAPAPAVAAEVPPEGSDLCYLTVREAVAKPELDVDRVPAPIKMDPPAFKPPYPKGVWGKANSMTVKIAVLVDTLGKADMATFRVDTTSHPWFATQLKAAVAKWKFSPAMKAGCKVPRTYKLGISIGAGR